MSYLDYNATAPMRPSVVEVMRDAMQQYCGNASSPHYAGREARKALEKARRDIAELLNVSPEELIFTSGGTESNNAVLKQLILKNEDAHLITAQTEHPSILESCRSLHQNHSSFNATLLPVDEAGHIDAQMLREAIRSETRLISLMTANNETGVIHPVDCYASIAQEHNIRFHTDCVQGLGKLKIAWNHTCIDYASASAHKIGGPTGIGLLYIKAGTSWSSMMTGGKQEHTKRAGTESIALALGFAEALVCAETERNNGMPEQWLSFKQQIIDALTPIQGFFINGDKEQSLTNTLNFGFQGLKAETLLILMDQEEIALSSGSACSSGALESSPVLLAMGCSKAKSKSSLRLSMGWNTQKADIHHCLKHLISHVNRLYLKK